MADIQEVTTIYKAVVDDYVKDINQLIVKNKELDTVEKKQADDNVKNAGTVSRASQTRKQLLDAEIANLAKLKTGAKNAFTVPEIKKYSQDIAESQKNISLLKGETDSLNSVTSGLKGQFAALGAGILAAFSVQAVINFGFESVRAFREAEINAKKLQVALTNIGNEGEAAFKKLIDQSQELQKISIFSDDDIQRAQTQLVQFGLTSDEIEKLIPKILDLASAQGIDLAQATDTVIQGINGQTRALKPLGLEFKNTGDKAENLAIITDKLNKFQGQTAAILDTSAGRAANLGNQFDDLKEKIGALIESTGVLQQLNSAFSLFIDSFKTQEERSKEITDNVVKNVLVGLQAEADGLLNAAIKQQQAFDKLNNNEKEQFIAVERIKILEKFKDDLIAIDNKIIEERKRRDAITGEGALEETRAANIRIDALKKEEIALQEFIRIKEQAGKTNLGLTDEEQSKRDAKALQDQQRAIEELAKARQKALDDEKKIQEQINKLRVSTAVNEDQKIQVQLEIDEQSAKKAEDDKRAFDQILIDTEKKRADLFVLINKDAFDKINKLQQEREFNQDESNLNAFIATQDKIINESVTNQSEREKELTALKEFELRQRIQNLTDYGLDAKKAEKDLSDFQVEQIKKVADERIKVQEQINAQLKIKSDRDIDTSSLAGIEAQKNAIEQAAAVEIQAQADIVFSIRATEQERKLAAEKAYLVMLTLSNNLIDLEDKASQLRVEKFKQGFQIAAQFGGEFFSAITDILSNNVQSQIDNLETLRDAQIDALDAEQQRVQDQRDKNLISEKDFETQSANIKNKRVDTEKKINAQINAEKRKQAELDRALKIFNIVVQTAENAVRVFPLTVPPGLLVPVAIALGAIETAAVLSAPLPKFKEGVVDFKGKGTGTSDENIVRISNRESIIKATATAKYKEALTSINNNTFEKYIIERHLAPALIQHRRNYDEINQNNIANNIAHSLIVHNNNTSNGMTINDYIWANRNRKNDPDRIGMAVAKALQANNDIYRK